MSDDVSAGGSKMYRYDDVEPNVADHVLQPPEGWREALEAHLEKHLGECTVFHELISQTVHLDLYCYGPNESRPYYTIVTVGVSDGPLSAPEDADMLRYVELMLYLPPDWPMPTDGDMPEDHYWPFRIIKFLGRFVHEYNSFYAPLHTIPNGDPPAPYADNTELCCALLTMAAMEEESFHDLEIDAHPVTFLQVHPITRAEMELKLEEGGDELLQLLGENGVLDEPIVPGRPCFATEYERPVEPSLLERPKILQMLQDGLKATRRNWGEAQASMGFFAKRKFRFKPPAWMKGDNRGLQRIFDDMPMLRDKGEVVWGHIVQANQILFDPSETSDAPAAIIYSVDPWFDSHPSELERIAEGLFDAKGEVVNDPDVQRFGDMLEDEREVQMHLPVPAVLGHGRQVIYTCVIVHRKHLPVPALLSSLVPLLIAPVHTPCTMILPETYWDEQLFAYWQLRLRLLTEG